MLLAPFVLLSRHSWRMHMVRITSIVVSGLRLTKVTAKVNCIGISAIPRGKRKKAGISEPPWDEIDQARGDFSKWVNPARVPSTPGFRFIRPGGLSDQEVFDLAAHIVKGEKGLIPEENRFRWENQGEGIVLPPQQSLRKKVKTTKSQAPKEGAKGR
jgi:hypothetical protein